MPDSALYQALTDAGCHVTRFSWSGKNSHKARWEAAQDLKKHLREQITAHPGACQWLVAHSHGGNVAVNAAHEVRRSVSKAPRISTIALATPFIHARGRKPPGWQVFVLALFAPSLVATAVAKAVAGPRSGVDWLVTACGALALLAVLLCVVGAWAHRKIPRASLRETLRLPEVGPDELMIMRPASDEASDGLTAGQFVGFLAGVLGSRLASLILWAVFMLSILVLVLTSALTRSPFGLKVALIVFPIPGFIVVTTVAVMMICAWTFGFDGPYVCLSDWSVVEMAPPGRATIVQLRLFETGRRFLWLAHSEIYSQTEVIGDVVKVISGS